MKYATIVQTLCSDPICGVIHNSAEPDDVEPELFNTKAEARADIWENLAAGIDASDWDIETVTLDGDLMTIVDTGQTFNWREGH